MTFSRERRRDSARDPHGWTSLQNDLKVHNAYLDSLRNYFILDDDLKYVPSPPDHFQILGRIHCQQGLFVDVKKTLEVNSREQVRTVSYSYHAGVEGPQNRPIFRYDNAHTYIREGHEDEHHKHRFDPVNWQEIKPPEWIGRARWPHLNQVIEELSEWWDTIGQHLDLTGPS